MHKTHRLAVFAHGKESGPWGSKIRALARVAWARGYRVISPDYRGLADPQARVDKLVALAPQADRLVLVGSSMGGYVSAMACADLQPDALLLMAPALYLDGYPGEPRDCPADSLVVHGWRDDIVPVASAWRFARERNAALHLVDDGHRLADSVALIAGLFDAQLARLG